MWRIFIFAVLLGLAGCREPLVVFHNTDISGAQFGKSFGGMLDHQGKARALSDFQGKVVLVYFGYLSCPDECPTTLTRFAEAMKRLGNDASKVQVLFITVDPEHDSAEKLGAYVTAFYPTFIGLRADLPTTEAAAKEFKVFISRSKVNESARKDLADHTHEQLAGDEMIDHSAGTYVFDPAGRIRLYIKDDASVNDVASDLNLLIAGK